MVYRQPRGDEDAMVPKGDDHGQGEVQAGNVVGDQGREVAELEGG